MVIISFRYLARKHDVYGCSAKEAYECDMIADGLADLKEHFLLFAQHMQRQEDPASFHNKVRDKLLPRYMKAMESQLQRNHDGNGHFLVGTQLNYADVALLEVLELLEEVYPELVRDRYPLVSEFHHSVRKMERVREYLSSSRRNPPLNETYIAHVKEVLSSP